MRFLKRLTTLFDGTISLLAIVAACIYFFTMISVGFGVVMRYFVGRPLLWVIEITEYALLYITFLSAIWLLRREAHVKMDLVVNRLRPRVQTAIDIITSSLCAVMFLVTALYGGEVTWDHFQRGLYQPTSVLEIPDAYVLAVIPVGSFMLFLQFVRRTYRFLRDFKSPPDEARRL